MPKKKDKTPPPEAPRLEGVSWGGMIIPPPTPLAEDAVFEQVGAAERAKAEAEAVRAFVVPRFRELMGHDIPVEILGIQVLPSHNCLIVNDHLLLSFVEAKALLEQLDDPNA